MTESSPLFSEIESLLKQNAVVLFMKGTPHMPMCGFSGCVTQILARLGIPFHSINVLEDNEIRQGIKAFAQWPTIPQLYVEGTFIGGADIVKDMYESGELKTLFEEKGLL